MQTGSGFIKMEDSNRNTNGNGRCFEIAPASAPPAAPAPDMQYSISTCASCSKGNPATNDWIPSSQTCTVQLINTTNMYMYMYVSMYMYMYVYVCQYVYVGV
jgi:hypothetical protein